ncbi:unnamed protein product [Heligmosomoides polygyrus]|uniref:Uncharacterized protein n=1 Tax=Heligmosomoides polygyrus TaxID=6339 RepID=A0A183G1I3_HELPZ|nr:unnamed protein product [Heligmosomoides polygyrus]
MGKLVTPLIGAPPSSRLALAAFDVLLSRDKVCRPLALNTIPDDYCEASPLQFTALTLRIGAPGAAGASECHAHLRGPAKSIHYGHGGRLAHLPFWLSDVLLTAK